MKTTYKFILAALAATVTLASCTKDPVPGKSDSDSAVTYRTITVSFDSPTKAKLDGTKPRFEDGDTILLSDGTALDTCVVDVNERGVASITTKLKAGKPLKAVYPMKAVRYTDPEKIDDEPLIPTSQSGKFSDANICVAESDDGKMFFRNVYPILRFYVDSTIGVKSIKIQREGSGYVALDTVKGSDDHIITVDAGAGTLDKVTGESVCYVVVRHQVRAMELTFTSTTETQEDVVVRKSKSKATLEAGTIYNAFIPYYIQVGDQKWGYCNVGAFRPEDPGYYFAWADTVGYRWDAKGELFQRQYDSPTPEDHHFFDWPNYLYNGEKEAPDEELIKVAGYGNWPEGILLPKCDAAHLNWGGNWRMPEEKEMETLVNEANNADSTGVMAGKLKIPYSEFGYKNVLCNEGSKAEGYIWTKSLANNGFGYAFAFTFSCVNDGSVYKINTKKVDFKDLCLGYTIRPIYDETMSGDDAVGLQISPYTDGKTL